MLKVTISFPYIINLKYPSLEIYFLQLLGENISDEDGVEYDGDKIWPFQSFVEQLILDMFDPGK